MSAVNYAGALAKHLQLDLHLVHAIHNPVADINSSIILLEILMDNAKIIANQKFPFLIPNIKLGKVKNHKESDNNCQNYI